MKYVGGKHKIGKKIANILQLISPIETTTLYLEPFCGSLGVFKLMTDYKKCYASDFHPDLIALWRGIQNKTLEMPSRISKSTWLQLKNTKSPNAMKGLVGFGCSFGGVFFSGYSQEYAGSSNRNFYNETKRSLTKIAPIIQKKNVTFFCKSYDKWKPKNSLVYCDPPYKNKKGYKVKKRDDEFDHNKFWEIMRKWSKHNYVVISEEKAPKDFKKIWCQAKHRTLNKQKKHKKECLFVHESLFTKVKTLIKENKKKQSKTTTKKSKKKSKK